MYPQYLIGTPEQMHVLNTGGFSVGCTYVLPPETEITENIWGQIAESRSPLLVAISCPDCVEPYVNTARSHVSSLPIIVIGYQTLPQDKSKSLRVFSADWTSIENSDRHFAWNALVQAQACAPRS